MTNACPPGPPPPKKKKTQTHVLPSYGPVLHKFNETPLLDKVPSGMSSLQMFNIIITFTCMAFRCLVYLHPQMTKFK